MGQLENLPQSQADTESTAREGTDQQRNDTKSSSVADAHHNSHDQSLRNRSEICFGSMKSKVY